MKQKKSTNDNGRLHGVEAALQRAALRAREIVAQTGTPLVIWKNGKIVKLMIPPKRMDKILRDEANSASFSVAAKAGFDLLANSTENWLLGEARSIIGLT